MNSESSTDCLTAIQMDELLGIVTPLNRLLDITFFRDFAATQQRRHSQCLRDLIAEIQSAQAPRKAALPWLKLARFGERATDKGTLRNDANMQSISGVEGDYDAGAISPQRAADILRTANIAGLIYSSPSHTPNLPRWRVLCPTGQDLPVADRDALCAALNGVFEGILAPESHTRSQSYFYGRIDGAEKPECILVDGRAIDEAPELVSKALGRDGRPYVSRAAPPAIVTLADDDDEDPFDGMHPVLDWERVENALAYIPIEDADGIDGRELWLKLGMALHSYGRADAEAFAIWDAWSKPGEKYDARDQEKQWQTFGRRKAGSEITIASLYEAAKARGWLAKPPVAGTDGDFLASTGGDIENGDALAAGLLGVMKHARATKRWYVCDAGNLWTACYHGQEIEAAKAFARQNLDVATGAFLAAQTEGNRETKKRADVLCMNLPRLTAAVNLASSVPGIAVAPGDFDSDTMLLSVKNGSVDLRTGLFRARTGADLMSRESGATFDPSQACPMWDSLLTRVLPDVEMRQFLQRLVGYSLTGSVSAEVAVFMYGTGANGKTVVANVMAHLLGSYAVTVGTKLLTKSRSGNDSEADRLVCKLPGARLALANETGAGEIWNDQRLKEIVSNEDIAARQLYGEAFSFRPSHKIWIRANSQPGVHDASDGFWRRLLPIHFAVQIPESERIPDLDKKIIGSELAGVLNWAVKGCLDWQAHGLKLPAAVRREVAKYRADTDILGQWAAERCIPEIGAKMALGRAYGSYKEFCTDEGVSSPAKAVFGRLMRAKGYRDHPDTSVRAFADVRLRSAFADDGADVAEQLG